MDSIRFRLRIFLFALFGVMVIGTLGFMAAEDLSLADAFYFSIVTIATVGYGDIHPATQTGKIVAIVIIITGVGTFLGVVANATEMMLNRRESQARLEKLNMVIGAFFSEVGTNLLVYFSDCDPHIQHVKNELVMSAEWSHREFSYLKKRLSGYHFEIESMKVDFVKLQEFLIRKRDFLLRLLENPTLLEHESFTDLLRAVFHLTEELGHRDNIAHCPEEDRQHLAGDVKRAYRALVYQWIDYMKHLKDNYPYLFSLAIRTNPFDQKASPVIGR